MFAQTTHVGFACVLIPATWLYIPSSIEIRSGVSEPQGVKFGLSVINVKKLNSLKRLVRTAVAMSHNENSKNQKGDILLISTSP